MENLLLPFSLVLNFAVLGAFAGYYFYFGKRLNTLSAIKQDLENELQSTRSALEKLERVNASLQTENIEREKKFFNAQLALETMEKRLTDQRSGEEQLKADFKESTEGLKAEIKSAREEVSRNERECARMRAEAVEAHKRMEAAEIVASDRLSRFEKIEAAHVEQKKALEGAQRSILQLEEELEEARRTARAEAEARARVEAMESALGRQIAQMKEAERAGVLEKSSLQEELAELRLQLQASEARVEALRQSLTDASASGGKASERCEKLEGRVVQLQESLQRKEAALRDLEGAYRDSSGETRYAAHRHMQWTLNHFNPESITFKFTNEGARAYLVGVETNIPELRYELETGHDLPRNKEARIRLSIAKNAGARLKEIPDEFEMTVLYALHVFPIRFKIRPRQGQRIERLMNEPDWSSDE